MVVHQVYVHVSWIQCTPLLHGYDNVQDWCVGVIILKPELCLQLLAQSEEILLCAMSTQSDGQQLPYIHAIVLCLQLDVLWQVVCIYVNIIMLLPTCGLTMAYALASLWVREHIEPVTGVSSKFLTLFYFFIFHLPNVSEASYLLHALQ